MTGLVCFSLNGYMGNLWLGPQAEVAQYVQQQTGTYWQPIGYMCNSFPLSGGVASGLAEFKRQRQLHPGPYIASAWSEGAIILTLAVKAELAAGNHDFKGAAVYGNPYRAAGQWNPCPPAGGAVGDPGGAGIGGPRNNWVAPASWHNYAHGPNNRGYDGKGGVDLYTCCPTNGEGTAIRIIFDFVLTQWTGALDDMWLFGEELITNSIHSAIDVTKAIILAISFYGGQCKPHTDYDSYAGKTYLANLAKTLL
jgi:hypothetical protein